MFFCLGLDEAKEELKCIHPQDSKRKNQFKKKEKF